MLHRSSKVPMAFMLAATFALVACGSDAESAWGEDEDRTAAEEGAPEVEAREEAQVEPAPEAQRERPRTAPRTERTPETVRTDPDPLPPVPELREDVTSPSIPQGTSVPLRVGTTLSTQTSARGDQFYAVVTEEVLAADGMVLIPQGTRVRGFVAESRKSEGSDDDAVLAVVFETLLMDDREYPIQATVTETELETSTADSGARTATKVATGAAAGAVVGRILGRDTRSTIQGAAAGAVAGTAVALATRDGNAVLREGSTVVIRLDTAVPLVARR
jgi:hypothetical protein